MDEKEALNSPEDHLVVTKHSLKLGKKTLNYTVTTGTLVLKETSEAKGDKEGEFEGDKPKAEVFFVAYTLDRVKDIAKRPITFTFNGGPGSSSVWLHMGLFGPKRVLFDKEGHPTPPPYALVDNEYSLLDESDFVFIDPVSTGYSRPVEGEKAKAFHNLKKDIASVGDFIRLYTSRYGRWGSPKFLAGESYGTTRAAGLSGYLQERHGMYLNGLMLISSVLNFQTLLYTHGNDLPYALFLPSFTATAWYHNKLSKTLQAKPLIEVLAEVESFVINDYSVALMKGASLAQRDEQAMLRKLARYTGLSEAYLQQTNLRIHINRFCKELLRDERRSVGRLDSRFKGIDKDAAGELTEFDPSMSTIMGPYTACFNDYVRHELGYESDVTYEILSGLYKTWSWSDNENKFVDVAETLRKAMSANPHLRVHIASGYYDLATPYFATEYTVNHLQLDASLRGHISTSYYEAGHMMYVQLASLKKLKKHLGDFLKNALA